MANLNALQAITFSLPTDVSERRACSTVAASISPSFSFRVLFPGITGEKGAAGRPGETMCSPFQPSALFSHTKHFHPQARVERRKREEAAAAAERMEMIRHHGLDPNMSISEYEQAMTELRRKVKTHPPSPRPLASENDPLCGSSGRGRRCYSHPHRRLERFRGGVGA